MAGSIYDAFGTNGASWTNLDDGSAWTHATVAASNFDTSPTYDNTSGLGRALYKLNARPVATFVANIDSTTNATSYATATALWYSNVTYLIGVAFCSSASGTAATTLSSITGMTNVTLVTGTDTTLSSTAASAAYSVAWYTATATGAITVGSVSITLVAAGTAQGCQAVILSMGTEASVRNGIFARCSGGNTAETSPRTVTVSASDLNTSTVIGFGVCDKNSSGTTVSGTNYSLLDSNAGGTPAISVATGTVPVASLASSNAIGMLWTGGTSQVWAVSACEVYDPDESSSNVQGVPGLLTHKAGTLTMRDIEIYAKVDNGYQGPMVRLSGDGTNFIFARQTYAAWDGDNTLSWAVTIYTCTGGNTITAISPVNATTNGDGKTSGPYQNIALRCYDILSGPSTTTVMVEAKAYDDGYEPSWNAAGSTTILNPLSSTQAFIRSGTASSATFAGPGHFGMATVVSALPNDPSNTFGIDTFQLNILPVRQQNAVAYRQAVPRASRW